VRGRALIAAALGVAMLAAAACGAKNVPAAAFWTGPGAMAVLSIAVSDRCPSPPAQRAAAWRVWVDGAHRHDVLAFPGAGPSRYESLLGPLADGRHEVELRPSELWQARCLFVERLDTKVYEPSDPDHGLLRHAPVIELRADTIGEQTDLPLYAYAERVQAVDGLAWRYTVVFSNEDGGTPTRALFARWGRTT
jgi:hypothetical protein